MVNVKKRKEKKQQLHLQSKTETFRYNVLEFIFYFGSPLMCDQTSD